MAQRPHGSRRPAWVQWYQPACPRALLSRHVPKADGSRACGPRRSDSARRALACSDYRSRTRQGCSVNHQQPDRFRAGETAGIDANKSTNAPRHAGYGLLGSIADSIRPAPKTWRETKKPVCGQRCDFSPRRNCSNQRRYRKASYLRRLPLCRCQFVIGDRAIPRRLSERRVAAQRFRDWTFKRVVNHHSNNNRQDYCD